MRASPRWLKYSNTYPARGAIAFLVAMLAFAVVALLLSLAFRPWRESKGKEKQEETDDKIDRPAVFQSPPTLGRDCTSVTCVLPLTTLRKIDVVN
jgi:hypothetical protein